MPYLINGNARTYIQNNSDCDRQKIVRSQLLGYRLHNNIHKLYHVSLGLVYLHSHNIVHGDLKLVCDLIIRVLPVSQ